MLSFLVKNFTDVARKGSAVILSLYTCSCTNSKCSDEPIQGYFVHDIKRETGLSQLNKVTNDSINALLDRLAGIAAYDSNRHSLQLKIYTSFGNARNEKLVFIEKTNYRWTAKEIRYQLDVSIMQDTIYVRINAIRSLSPRYSWEALYDTLANSNMFVLSGDVSLKGYNRSMGKVEGVTVAVESKSGLKSYSYNEIELNKKFREVEDLSRILDFIDNAFNGQYVYRSCQLKE